LDEERAAERRRGSPSLGQTAEGGCPPDVVPLEAGAGAQVDAVYEEEGRTDERAPFRAPGRDPRRTWDWYVAIGAACASLISFLTYSHRGDILLFGDAVAHINIARRVFDSRTPGPLQLGTVWLPMPHLLMMPFIVSRWMWRTGVGASIPSMIAYVFGVVGICRLVRGAMRIVGRSDMTAQLAAIFAAAIYGLNPNLLYVQATAMTESLYLALFIWALVYFSEFWRSIHDERERVGQHWELSLTRCGLCLLGACLTRYDGWFVAGVLGVAVVLMLLSLASREQTRTWGSADSAASESDSDKRVRASERLGSRTLRRPLVIFLVLASAGPVLWLVYNGIVYKNPLEFANGPYSAKAIERNVAVPGFPPHPGSGSPGIAALYFMKAGESSVAEAGWQRTWLWFALLSAGWLLWRGRRAATLFLLWLPVPFYMLSVAYSGVPIFSPDWWPFSFYNVRYGVQLLPALAVFVALAATFVVSLMVTETGKRTIAALMVGFVALSYAGVWRAGPVAYREAWVNSRTRLQLEGQLAEELRRLPGNASLLMYLGEHVGALQEAGIPLRRTISEGSHRVWMQPSDPEGLWERSLADPGKYADFVVASEGDRVWQAVHDRNLPELARIEVTGQKTAYIWRAR
jgi:hypothetical protein